jgi:hypothetical protein
MAREVIVDKSVIAQSNMTIVMEYVNIQLNEVVIQEASRLSAESIGIIPYGQNGILKQSDIYKLLVILSPLCC